MPDGLEIGGHEQRTDWPKMGPSLLIATCVILAIRTAKWKPDFDKSTAHPELEREIGLRVESGRTCSVGAGVQEGRDVSPETRALVSAE
jgi:hypothetical protein